MLPAKLCEMLVNRTCRDLSVQVSRGPSRAQRTTPQARRLRLQPGSQPRKMRVDDVFLLPPRAKNRIDDRQRREANPASFLAPDFQMKWLSSRVLLLF